MESIDVVREVLRLLNTRCVDSSTWKMMHAAAYKAAMIARDASIRAANTAVQLKQAAGGDLAEVLSALTGPNISANSVAEAALRAADLAEFASVNLAIMEAIEAIVATTVNELTATVASVSRARVDRHVGEMLEAIDDAREAVGDGKLNPLLKELFALVETKYRPAAKAEAG